ncbi:MFS transporter [Coleofasciculus sp. FACHB-542]|uniref:MFS transporter n=1 Tax=Coleofasciculus sp. FACHB-542 TaxID=2692787 RepID=UPI00168399CA|nr:MFS transporter [Coleofasciculus sp. FACHB-542]MBD2087997.1 MFS transporter [Coleofasciculus sp. FACHB-542]
MSDSSSEHSPATPDSEKLKLSTKLAYGAGDVGAAITANIGVFYTAYFLTDVAGIAAGLATWILLIGKVWDAVNDPVVGVLSDRTNSPRWGRRLPWMLYGAIPFGITFFLQWLVPRFSANDSANQWGLFWYYIVISILFNSFYTAVNLPYTALTPELTQDYNERTNLNSYRFAFSIGGSIVSVIVFGIIAALIPNDRIQQYLVMGVVCAILSVLPIYWCIWGTRDRILARAAQNPTFEQPVSLPILQQVRIVLSNRPFLYVVGIYLCSWLAVQVTAAIIPYFVLSWMRLSDAVVAQVILAVQGTALLMLFIWSKLSQRYGKKAVYFMGMSVWIIAQAGLFFLQPGQIAFMYVLGVMAGFGVSTAYLIPWSMLPDVIELDELKTGQRREGIFYSFMVFLQKVSLAVAVALVLKSLEWNQYIRSTPENLAPIQPDSALLAIRIAIGPLPTIALICGLILAYFYPLTREVHADILLKLKERKLKAR